MQYKIEIGKLKQQVKDLKELNSDLSEAQSLTASSSQQPDGVQVPLSSDQKQQML